MVDVDRPLTDAVGASNLGHIILYSLLTQREGLLCDRAYYPGDDMQVGACSGGGGGVCGGGWGWGWGGCWGRALTSELTTRL